ncbi:7-dehydrocholesterol reductase [Bulinus truncatus]|nr:7-dehydrocholesterol reductase [Bulinus truncatus]
MATEMRYRKDVGENYFSSNKFENGGSQYDVPTDKGDQQFAKKFVHYTLIPLLLMATTPNFVIILWYTIVHCNGSFLKMLSLFAEKSVLSGLAHMWSLTRSPSPFIVIRNIPVYTDNGFLYFVITMGLFWTLTLLLRPFGISPSIYYDRFDEILITLNAFSLIFCAVLYLKGKLAPSSTDSGSSGNIIFDYYWGMELYPRIFGFDVKVFTNCRFGLMLWALMVCINALKSYELHGFVDSMFVSATLQIIYLAKFYWWEAGYFSTIDIMLDRAGFMICWGCMVFIPGLFTSISYYLVTHPVRLGLTFSSALLVMGILSIYVNYQADAQKQIVRKTDGECSIWGQKPDIIRAEYQLDNGEIKESILLASGWWGVSRHFHYLPEILLAVTFALPAMFENLLPYSYVIFLAILLTHRSFRDERKCSEKYGNYWRQYCNKVQYRVVPFVF